MRVGRLLGALETEHGHGRYPIEAAEFGVRARGGAVGTYARRHVFFTGRPAGPLGRAADAGKDLHGKDRGGRRAAAIPHIFRPACASHFVTCRGVKTRAPNHSVLSNG